VAQSEREIRDVARAVGEPARGEKLIATIERALVEARPRDANTVPALMWMSGGMVPGAGTLADELLQRTGFHNMSAAYGLKQWDVLPLEHLLASPPALVLSLAPDDAIGDLMLQHPAVTKLKERVPFRAYPFRLLQCGGPTIVQAVARLSEVRREMEPR
jgi:iron complex transport system substrate-binding protein